MSRGYKSFPTKRPSELPISSTMETLLFKKLLL